MKVINKNNYFPIVCIVYTLLSIFKILIEMISLGKFGNDEKNFIAIFLISCMATFVLSQHYRLQKIPFLVVVIGQYIVLVTLIMVGIWISSYFEEIHPNGYRDMFLSFTIPYIVLAIIYYIQVFHEIRKVNSMLTDIQKKENKGWKSK